MIVISDDEDGKSNKENEYNGEICEDSSDDEEISKKYLKAKTERKTEKVVSLGENSITFLCSKQEEEDYIKGKTSSIIV